MSYRRFVILGERERWAIELHWRAWGLGVAVFPADVSLFVGPITVYWKREAGE